MSYLSDICQGKKPTCIIFCVWIISRLKRRFCPHNWFTGWVSQWQYEQYEYVHPEKVIIIPDEMSVESRTGFIMHPADIIAKYNPILHFPVSFFPTSLLKLHAPAMDSLFFFFGVDLILCAIRLAAMTCQILKVWEKNNLLQVHRKTHIFASCGSLLV